MNIENVKNILIYGSYLEYQLFKSAIHFAELGLIVWFISPEPFGEIPNGIETPEKDVLKLITFLYLKDHTELLTHLNNIHCWFKMPHVILCNDLNNYIQLQKNNLSFSAYCVSSLIDAAYACSKKHNRLIYIISSIHEVKNDFLDTLQSFANIYYDNIIEITNAGSLLLNGFT